ncbi:hypothetical protein O6P43_009320 [Quillaja saponaria]|uniref:Uncharacterized protein n=1 Tax=Quillaja saponaria TaxID=32244 RepID=A0AAD7PY31_QUISA|nr:hypothetical protein O6P43_009320 [Quillaja saponaria]
MLRMMAIVLLVVVGLSSFSVEAGRNLHSSQHHRPRPSKTIYSAMLHKGQVPPSGPSHDSQHPPSISSSTFKHVYSGPNHDLSDYEYSQSSQGENFKSIHFGMLSKGQVSRSGPSHDPPLSPMGNLKSFYVGLLPRTPVLPTEHSKPAFTSSGSKTYWLTYSGPSHDPPHYENPPPSP